MSQTVFKNTDYRMDGNNAVDPLMHELLKPKGKNIITPNLFPPKCYIFREFHICPLQQKIMVHITEKKGHSHKGIKEILTMWVWM